MLVASIVDVSVKLTGATALEDDAVGKEPVSELAVSDEEALGVSVGATSLADVSVGDRIVSVLAVSVEDVLAVSVGATSLAGPVVDTIS